MSVQVAGVNGTTIQDVDPTFKAQRTTLRPYEVLGWQSFSAVSGAATVLAASAPIFSLRNLSSNLILLRRVGVQAVVTTGFTAAQQLQVALTVARAFTVSDSAGTAIAFTGSNQKHRTSLATPTSLDCRIATTTALTAGTRTLDALPLGLVSCWCTAAGVGSLIGPSPNNLLQHDTGDYPLVLAQNEGAVITLPLVMGAGGVVTWVISAEFGEATSF